MRRSTSRGWDAVALGAIGLSAAASVLAYAHLPAQVATHFDLSGKADGFMTRAWAAACLPLMALGLWALLRFAPRILPKSEQARLSGRVVSIINALVAILLSAVHGLILSMALGVDLAIQKPVHALVGMLFVGLGLVFPRVRRNALVGVRTPWTLTSDENWSRTHRVAGACLVVGGLLGGVLGVTLGPVGGRLALAAFVASALVPAAYSLWLARKLEAEMGRAE